MNFEVWWEESIPGAGHDITKESARKAVRSAMLAKNEVFDLKIAMAHAYFAGAGKTSDEILDLMSEELSWET
jgi:hypothetical protein